MRRPAAAFVVELLATMSAFGCQPAEPTALVGSESSTSAAESPADATSTAGPAGDGASSDATAAGTSTGATSTAATDDSGGAPTGPYLVPNPLVSVGASIAASASTQSSVAGAFDGRVDTGEWRASGVGPGGVVEDMWATIELGHGTPCEGPQSLLLVWHVLGNPDYTIDNAVNYNSPSDYTIEVSPDGATWTTVVEVTSPERTYRSRGHRFEFAGMCFVRFTVTGMHTGQSDRVPAIGEVAIYDTSAGNDDTWVFVGNGPSRFAYDEHVYPSFSHAVTAAHPDYSPAMLDAADLEGSLDYVLDNLGAWLELNAAFRHWVLVLGLEEAGYGMAPGDIDFTAKVQQMIDTITAAGGEVVLPRMQYADHPSIDLALVAAYNQEIDALVASNELAPAPDLYAFFSAHPELLCSSESDCEPQWIGISPADPDGYIAVNQQWAAALDGLYAP